MNWLKGAFTGFIPRSIVYLPYLSIFDSEAQGLPVTKNPSAARYGTAGFRTNAELLDNAPWKLATTQRHGYNP
jgi:hypothetical protein